MQYNPFGSKSAVFVIPSSPSASYFPFILFLLPFFLIPLFIYILFSSSPLPQLVFHRFPSLPPLLSSPFFNLLFTISFSPFSLSSVSSYLLVIPPFLLHFSICLLLFLMYFSSLSFLSSFPFIFFISFLS